MATDYTLLVYAKLLQMMQEGTTGSLTGAARIKRWVVFNDVNNKQPEPIHVQQPADLPRITFDLDSDTDSGLTLTRTFANPIESFVRQATPVYRVRIILNNSDLSAMTTILSAIRFDLQNNRNRDLGIDGCQAEIQQTTFKNRRTSQDEEAPGHRRRVGELLIPVRITFLGESEF